MITILMLSGEALKAQIVTNGTFDGPPSTSVPPGWQSCLTTSTVEIQPGPFGVINIPQDGNTFLGMACRALDVPDTGGTCEEVGQFLTTELIAGRCYLLEVYLAFSPELSVTAFRNSIDFKAFVGTEECQNDVEVAHFGPIDHREWRKYTTTFSLNENRSYVWLQGAYTQLPEYSGYILADNFSLTDLSQVVNHEIELCEGTTATLASTFQSADSFLWSSGETSSSIEINEVGQYVVDVVIEGCSSREVFNVVEMSDPDPVMVLFCEGESVTLTPTVLGADSYVWSTGATSATITLDTPGEYFVDIVNDGCATREVFNISKEDNPDPVQVEFCQGESAILTSSFLTANSYVWSTGSDQGSIEITSPGQYSVQAQLGSCLKTEIFNVLQVGLPIINIISENEICTGEQIQLDAFQENAAYIWQDGSTESSFVVEEPGTYSVRVTLNGCSSEQRIEVFPGECEAILRMPNAFTPNGDGKNDLFIPIESIGTAIMSTRIFNRWGHEIFSTQNLNIEWNGNFSNGEPAPETTYYWSIRYAAIGGRIQSQKGTVNLIR